MTRLLPIDAETYVPNELHSAERAWQETNCYVDVWIEVLHALGLDPVPALAFLLSVDFDGDQWRFFKYPLSDLRSLYGIHTFEMNIWRGVEFHVQDQLAAGRLMTIEMDSWYLPDTAGTSYRHDHTKTTIAPNMIDPEALRLGYFHNTGYHELTGEDYAGVFRHHLRDNPEVLAPYAELVRLDGLRRPEPAELLDATNALVGEHLGRRPAQDPVRAMAKRMEEDFAWLKGSDLDLFHGYAFATLRQCGASAELAASLCGWLADRGEPVGAAVDHFLALSSTVKTVQFKLARLVAGRDIDVTPLLADMAGHHEAATAVLVERYDP